MLELLENPLLVDLNSLGVGFARMLQCKYAQVTPVRTACARLRVTASRGASYQCLRVTCTSLETELLVASARVVFPCGDLFPVRPMGSDAAPAWDFRKIVRGEMVAYASPRAIVMTR